MTITIKRMPKDYEPFLYVIQVTEGNHIQNGISLTSEELQQLEDEIKRIRQEEV